MYVLHQQLREKRELHYEFRHLVGVILGLVVFGSATFYTGLVVGERYGAAGQFHDPDRVYEVVFGTDDAPSDSEKDENDVLGLIPEPVVQPELVQLEQLGELIPASAPKQRKQDKALDEDEGELEKEERPSAGSENSSFHAAALAQQILEEQERLALENQRQQKEARELAEKARIAKENAERERQAKIKAEQERLAQKRAEDARQARINVEKQRLALKRVEEERAARLEAEKKRLALKKAEEERQARIKAEQERMAQKKAEEERQARIKAEQERMAQKKAEQDRLAKQKAEKARLARLEEDRLRAAKIEEERAQQRQQKKMLPAVIRSQGPLPLIDTLQSTSQPKVDAPTAPKQRAKPVKVVRAAQAKMNVSKKSSRKFTLQLFSFQDDVLAQTMVKTLRPFQGQSAYVTEVHKNGGAWYRVHMGTFDNLGDVRAFQKAIESSRGLANTFPVSK